jgi:hypothetical protein
MYDATHHLLLCIIGADMTLNERILEAGAKVRERAAIAANQALETTRERAAKRVAVLKGSLNTLSRAGKQLNTVARLHAGRLVEKNKDSLKVLAKDSKATWEIVADAGKDVSSLARKTFQSLIDVPAPKKVAKAARTRKPRARKTAKA